MRSTAARNSTTALFLGCALGMCSGATTAEEVAGNKWQWSLAPYLWLISLDGEQKTHDDGSGIDIPIELDMGAAVSGLEFGMLGHLEARKSKWGWFVDAAYVALELEANLGPIAFEDIGFDGVEAEFAGVYSPGGPNGRYDFFVGLRYWDLAVEVPIAGDVIVTKDVSWTDFLAGARYTAPLGNEWHLALRGDLAGSSNGSDLTVNLHALLARDVFKTGAVLFGWRYLGTKFVEGNPDDVNDASYHELEITMSGPVLSYQFNW